MPKKAYKTWKEKRLHETGAAEEPGSWFYLEHPTHSDWYSLSMALKFIDAAQKYGIDPYDYLALGISETGLGNPTPSNPAMASNPARIDWGQHEERLKKLYPEFKARGELPEVQREVSIDYGARYLSEMLNKYINDKLAGLQAYSGAGKTIYGGSPEEIKEIYGTTKFFGGRPYKEIDFWKEKPQAKRITEISDILRGMPELEGLISKPESIKEKEPVTEKGPTTISEFLELMPEYASIVGQ